MAHIDFSIDSLPVSESSFEPLPAGWYDVGIQSAELKATKTGGQMIAIKYKVAGPSHAGRVVFGNLNIKNQNPKAEEIGRQQLGELMRAIGIPRVTDTDQLIGHNLQIKLSIREAQGGYDASNDVKGYKPQGGAMPAMQAAPVRQAAPAPAAPARTAPPWAKKAATAVAPTMDDDVPF